MNTYIVMAENAPQIICWTALRAQEVLKELEASGKQGRIVEVPIESLTIPVSEYYKFRGYKFPNAHEAFLFLTSEVGELADRLVQSLSNDWVRNHPEAKHSDPRPEIGDVLMMLTATCMALVVDPIECMFDKWRAKGFHSGQG